MRRFRASPWLLPLCLALTASVRGAEPDAAQLEFFEKRIRPLLVENCHSCHSTGKKHKANLVLDSRAGLLKGGDTGPVVMPGQPEKSRLIQAVGYQDADLRMPPKSKLAAEQIEALTAWVRMGAPWPEEGVAKTVAAGKPFNMEERRKHWAFQPIQMPAIPDGRGSQWAQSPVDAFVLAKLQAAELAPAKPADKRTLLRRVTYDLIGLPPTPAEIDAFLADDSPDAYEKVVNRLLASPHYGERWGRHWLDLVRYAETSGHEFDFDLPEAYAYRDYVVRAFNADLPYDQFVVEHIAGDLLPAPRVHPSEGFNESILGTGFWFLGESVHSPVDVRGDEADRIDNQIDVLGKAFLGLTVACARCHDHKFDAIAQKDYYAFVGYLRSSRYQRAFIDPVEPTRSVVRYLREMRRRMNSLASEVAAQALAEQVKSFESWASGFRKTNLDRPDHPLHPWAVLAGRETPPEQFAAKRRELIEKWKRQQAEATARQPRYTVFEDFNRGDYSGWFVAGLAFGERPSTLADVAVQPDQRVPVGRLLGPGLAHSGLVAGRLQGALRSKTFTISNKYILYRVAGTGSKINLIIDGFQRIQEPIYGGLTIAVNHGDRLEWRVQNVGMWLGHTAYVEFLDDGPGYLAADQILFTDDGSPPPAVNGLLRELLDDPAVASREALAGKYQQLLLDIIEQWRTGTFAPAPAAAERIALLDGVLQSDLGPAVSTAETARLRAMLEAVQLVEARLPVPRRALAAADGTGWNERLHIRGSHKNLGEEVPRRFLEALGGDQQPAPPATSGRLELARRLVEPSNVLLSRVLVNRVWQHHFGEGLVRSVDNFGILGELPTHPELLDYLATEFARRDWSIKALHRMMVLSSTYRMASDADPKAEQADPRNEWLHRMPVRRLEAEAVRDAIIAVSGRLDRRLYGPSVLPHLTPFMQGRGRPNQSGPLDGDGRRTLYLNIRRNFLTPILLAFDYPIPFTTMGKRSVSNVPAQALTLMNNPFVLQQAERWAKGCLAESGLSAQDRVRRLYVTAFARPPSATELAEAAAFVEEQSRQYGRDDDSRSWADLCHVLVNVKEFVYVR